jgi:DNA-binding winged helix-turn-helix (wHTH) protein/GTP-binding protein EngB required for normal cell division
MPVPFPAVREPLIKTILQIVAGGECGALFGLSNTGKSPLLRALAAPETLALYESLAGRPGLLVYIDCNRVVELTAPGFYEIVVRSLLEMLEGNSSVPPLLLSRLREQHSVITTAASVFQASLAFNNAFFEICTQSGRNLVLLFDEFDEVYAALEDRTLLNLRALKDKFQDRLTYLTATVRPLNESRTPGDNEFAELFTAHPLALGLLTDGDTQQIIKQLWEGKPDPKTMELVTRLAGGHFGLLAVLLHAAQRNPQESSLLEDPNARAECLKIWNQLRPEEQAALKSLITQAEEGLPAHDRERLQGLGLLTADRRIFSLLFATFVRRQSAAPAQTTVGVVVDEDAGEVWVDGLKVTILTDLEYRLMKLLYQRQDRLTTKELIVDTVWGSQYLDNVDDARIEKLVSRLRAKVEHDPANPRYLLTQRGRGYKLSSRPAEGKEENDN